MEYMLLKCSRSIGTPANRFNKSQKESIELKEMESDLTQVNVAEKFVQEKRIIGKMGKSWRNLLYCLLKIYAVNDTLKDSLLVNSF